ncbi:pseudouridine synthase [Mediannikoviicoccus vaginalis]|uniref:pseudouridine synthase n=1 Tax=Mediannikoviicoccus vaginalis TaxID=2899727 RepID=UPI001F3535C5|nr:pseudouridine synthase [Mediannikoviicoccus vaginalis]
MKIRVDKLIANMGFATRSEIKKASKKGAVLVNDEVEKNFGRIVDTDIDRVSYFGDPVEYKEFIYLLMNKPKGVISATEDFYDKTVIDLLLEEHTTFNPFPVGRLDKDTTGLLLITNDGELNHNLTSPKREVPKTYKVTLESDIEEEDYNSTFEKGIKLMPENIITKPATMEVIDNRHCYLTIKEGKYHQVKRMFEKVGNKVIELERVKFGALELPSDLELGEYIEITKEDIID